MSVTYSQMSTALLEIQQQLNSIATRRAASPAQLQQLKDSLTNMQSQYGPLLTQIAQAAVDQAADQEIQRLERIRLKLVAEFTEQSSRVLTMLHTLNQA
jgi:tRNA A22 N-methylase